MKNKFKISQSLRASVENILKRRAIKYELTTDEKNVYCVLDLSGEKFHKIILRAMMEKLQEEESSEIPYVAIIETEDAQVMSEVGEAYIIK